MRFGASAVAALVAVASLACDTTTTKPGATNSVTVSDDYFSPTTDTVSVGDSVLFIWAGSNTHDVLAASNSATWCAARASGFCTVSFPTAGSYLYYCHFHANMQATVVAK